METLGVTINHWAYGRSIRHSRREKRSHNTHLLSTVVGALKRKLEWQGCPIKIPTLHRLWLVVSGWRYTQPGGRDCVIPQEVTNSTTTTISSHSKTISTTSTIPLYGPPDTDHINNLTLLTSKLMKTIPTLVHVWRRPANLIAATSGDPLKPHIQNQYSLGRARGPPVDVTWKGIKCLKHKD